MANARRSKSCTTISLGTGTSATGFATTPLVHVLAHTLDQVQTGAVVLREPEDVHHLLYFEDGAAKVVRSGNPTVVSGQQDSREVFGTERTTSVGSRIAALANLPPTRSTLAIRARRICGVHSAAAFTDSPAVGRGACDEFPAGPTIHAPPPWHPRASTRSSIPSDDEEEEVAPRPRQPAASFRLSGRQPGCGLPKARRCVPRRCARPPCARRDAFGRDVRRGPSLQKARGEEVP